MTDIKIGIAKTGDPLSLCTDILASMTLLLESMGGQCLLWNRDLKNQKDSSKALAFFENEGADLAIIMCCALAGAGEIVIPFMKSDIPYLIWCVPEPTREGYLLLNSMTCANLYTSVQRQYNTDKTKGKWLYGIPDDALCSKRLETTIKAIRAIKRFSNMKVARIGGTAPGFINLAYDEDCIKRRLGTTVTDFEIDQIYEIMDSIDSARVEILSETLGKNKHTDDISQQQIENTARLVLALKDLHENEGYDAFALSCWPRFQKERGFSTCFAHAILNDAGIVVSCEGDIPGALSMIAANTVTNGHAMIMDMVAMDIEADALAFWHCGMGLPSYADSKGFELIKCPFLPELNDQPGISLNMKFAPGPITFFRFINSNFSKVFCFEADFINGPDESYTGTRGWVSNFSMNGERLSVKDVFNTICVSGMEHHYVMVKGHVESALVEMSNRLGIEVVQPEPYRDFV